MLTNFSVQVKHQSNCNNLDLKGQIKSVIRFEQICLNEEKRLFKEMPEQTFSISGIWVCDYFKFNKLESCFKCINLCIGARWNYCDPTEAKNGPFTVR